MDRRAFLASLACSAAASPLWTPVVFAQAPWETRLVVIVLRGAMDGVDAVRPIFDPGYRLLRPGLAGETGVAVEGGWELHPGLAALAPLWQAGEMGAVHAVSTPYRDRRSHFDGQDVLETGSAGVGMTDLRDGWLNRALTLLPGVEAETACAVGSEELLILVGDAPVSRWTPGARLRISPQAARLIEIVQHDDPLFRAASAEAIRLASGLADEDIEGRGHVRLAGFTASRLRGDTRIASFSLSGWDTHARQRQGLTLALEKLAETILALKDGLGDVWAKTAVVCLTEFGRTARENGSGGTDHGTGGAMLYAGGALRGGQVLGDWPGLDALYDDRDLMPTRDVRGPAAWALAAATGLPVADIERAVFPGLDAGAEPGFLL